VTTSCAQRWLGAKQNGRKKEANMGHRAPSKKLKTLLKEKNPNIIFVLIADIFSALSKTPFLFSFCLFF